MNPFVKDCMRNEFSTDADYVAAEKVREEAAIQRAGRAWQKISITMPAYITHIPIGKRQQSSELYGVKVACQLCVALHIIQPTLPAHAYTRTHTTSHDTT